MLSTRGLKRSFLPLKRYCSSTIPTQPSEINPPKRSLFRILNGLRHFGLGSKVTRNIYKFPDTFWIITRVKLSKDQNHGKVHGRLVWRGLPKGKDKRIGPALKKQWILQSLPNYKHFRGTPEEIEKLIPTNTERTV